MAMAAGDGGADSAGVALGRAQGWVEEVEGEMEQFWVRRIEAQGCNKFNEGFPILSYPFLEDISKITTSKWVQS